MRSFRRHWEGTLDSIRSRPRRSYVYRLLLCLMALAACTILALPVGAQISPDVPSEEATPLPLPADGATGSAALGTVVSTWDFVRMLLLLAAVVAAIYVLFLVLRKVAGSRTEERGLIHVIDSKTLAPGRSLHLVQVGDDTYLVGSSEHSVNIVASITAKDLLEGDAPQGQQRLGSGRRTFAETVQDLLHGRSPAASTGNLAVGTSEVGQIRSRPKTVGDSN